MSFEAWKAEVDRLLLRKIGLDSDDLPDYGYFMAWEDGSSPAEVVDEVLAENDLDGTFY